MFSGNLRVRQGTIVDIDRVRWTCTVKFDDGTVQSDICISPIYVNSGGNGIYFVPEVNSLVLVASVKDKVFLLATSYPVDEEKIVESSADTDRAADFDPSHSAKRPILGEGDYLMSTKGGGHLIMRGSGVVEIGASQISKRFYIPTGNFIRDLCQNYKLEADGGSLSLLSRVGDGTHGTVTGFVNTNPSDPNDVPQEVEFTKSPVQFNLNIKEFAEDANELIQLSMGRLKNTDGINAPLIGSPAKDFDHSAIVQLNINNKLTLFIDKFGTVVQTFSGPVTQTYQSSVDISVGGNKAEVIVGQYKRESSVEIRNITGTESLKVSKDSNRVFESNLNTRVLGNKSEEIQGSFIRKNNSSEITNLGSSKEMTTGDKDIITASALTIGAGEKTSQTFGNGYEGVVASGDYTLKNILGSTDIRVLAGTASLSFVGLSEVSVNSVRAKMKFQGGSSVEVNATGAALKSSGGEISVDQTGNVTIGSKVGLAGGIITTATNPFCFVTGLPLLGSATVKVRSSGTTIASPAPPVPSNYLGT